MKHITIKCLVVLFLFNIYTISSGFGSLNTPDPAESDDFQINVGIIHSPINIDGNGDFTPSNGVSSGEGTYENPYIIRDLIIEVDGLQPQNCINITNTNVYFKIENCILKNSGSAIGKTAIRLINVSNGQIFNNYIKFAGIDLINSHKNNIAYNSLLDCEEIYLFFSDNNNIWNNYIRNSTYGILLISSNDNTIEMNEIYDCREYAIGIWFASNYSIIRNNHIFNNGNQTGEDQIDIDSDCIGTTLSGNVYAYDDEVPPSVDGNPWQLTLPLILIISVIVSIVSAVMIMRKYTHQSLLEKLSFTAGYPNIIKPETWYSLFFYLHLPKFQNNVRKILDERGFYPAVSVAESFNLIERGTRLNIIPNVKGITFNPTKQEIAWYEDIQEVLFRLKADSSMLDCSLIGSIDIFKGSLLIGQLPVSIKVSMVKQAIEMVMANSKIFEKLFASYSHRDAAIVNQCILSYKALGIKVYIDKESLRSGQNWEKKLARLIERADVFQLYWSKAASESLYVQKEWEYALILMSQKGEKFIRPCYWEIPMPDPPQDLEPFHFAELDIRKLKKLGVITKKKVYK